MALHRYTWQVRDPKKSMVFLCFPCSGHFLFMFHECWVWVIHEAQCRRSLSRHGEGGQRPRGTSKSRPFHWNQELGPLGSDDSDDSSAAEHVSCGRRLIWSEPGGFAISCHANRFGCGHAEAVTGQSLVLADVFLTLNAADENLMVQLDISVSPVLRPIGWRLGWLGPGSPKPHKEPNKGGILVQIWPCKNNADHNQPDLRSPNWTFPRHCNVLYRLLGAISIHFPHLCTSAAAEWGWPPPTLGPEDEPLCRPGVGGTCTKEMLLCVLETLRCQQPWFPSRSF